MHKSGSLDFNDELFTWAFCFVGPYTYVCIQNTVEPTGTLQVISKYRAQKYLLYIFYFMG